MRYYIADTFTDTMFKGNSAGVCFFDKWPDDALMQNIAAENNLSETAFLIKEPNGYALRWFTPETEVDLCGHATLASAFVILNFEQNHSGPINFHTKSGILSVEKKDDLFIMDFPALTCTQTEVTELMQKAIGVPISKAYQSTRDLLLIIQSQRQLEGLYPQIQFIKQIPDCLGVIVSAEGNEADFVSRFFAPNAGINEDPVTGSSHSVLIPFWAQRLKKNIMVARQLSKRGGTLFCEHCGDRVKIGGKAVLYLQGEIAVP